MSFENLFYRSRRIGDAVSEALYEAETADAAWGSRSSVFVAGQASAAVGEEPGPSNGFVFTDGSRFLRRITLTEIVVDVSKNVPH